MIFKMINTHNLEEISNELTATFLKILYIECMNCNFIQSQDSISTNCGDEKSASYHKGSSIFACFFQIMVIPHVPSCILEALKKMLRLC